MRASHQAFSRGEWGDELDYVGATVLAQAGGAPAAVKVYSGKNMLENCLEESIKYKHMSIKWPSSSLLRQTSTGVFMFTKAHE